MKMITETHPYRIWHDSIAGYDGRRFATQEEAIESRAVWRAPFHFERVEKDGECVAIILPTYYWEK